MSYGEQWNIYMNKIMITEQSCGCEDFKELRVAFGDLNNCQLKCPFCFTLEQKPSNSELESLIHLPLKNVRIVRFTGGEPLFHQDQIDSMSLAINNIEERKLTNLAIIVIQTNAILSENICIDSLFKFKLPVLFEISFKGTNEKEYQHLTNEKKIDVSVAQTLMKKQLEGYFRISDKCASRNNYSVLARLGIFHSSINKPTFKFVLPDTKELMFHPNSWSEEFKRVHQDQKRLWGAAYGAKIVIEKLKTPADGSPGMGRRYREIIDQLKRRGLLIEDKSNLPEQFQSRYYYKRGNDIYWQAANCLHH